MTPEGLTDTWLSAVLQSDVRVRDSSRIGDGLVGMNVRLDLESDGSIPASMIAKLPSSDPTSRATGVGLRNYEREVCFYREIAPTVDIRVARCYYADWNAETGDFVLLMEDLAPAVQGNQISGCDRAQARTAVLELAKLHGPRWGDTALDDIEWLSRRTTDGSQQLAMLWAMFLPGFMSSYGSYLSTEAAQVVQRFGERITAWIDERDPPSTVTHGDYRLDNLMFAGPAGGAPIAAVDWQTPGHGIGITDVSYFLGASVLPAERRQIERGLVDEYGQALVDYGVAVDADRLWQQYRSDAYAGVVMSVIASQVVGTNDRSEAMFAAMATRHAQHVLDLDSESLL
ncbi:MAG: ecdysteroid 22-kinase family protein [Actinomycetota bacterium]|nr:ecdysteroid 22-kinase family protein [Actinomycetota bacterium]